MKAKTAPGGGGSYVFAYCPFEPNLLHARYLFPLHKSDCRWLLSE